MEPADYLNAYYSNYDEEGRLLSKHGQVEYLTTLRYIDRYLKEGMRVLEIGAGTGRYSHAIACRGYDVHAVELIQHNIDVFNSKTTPGETIAIRQGNATDLSFLDSDSFDITLLLGPMYHLFTRDDKLQALSEAIRVTKAGGTVFVSYCISDASILCYGFIKGKAFELIEKELLDPDSFQVCSRPQELFELHRKEDIDALMVQFDVSRLHYVATDLATNHMRETVDAMDDVLFQLYLKYHFSICERADMVGITHHSLDIFQKA